MSWGTCSTCSMPGTVTDDLRAEGALCFRCRNGEAPRAFTREVAWAYVLDRAGQYDPSSAIVTALENVAARLLNGEAEEAFAHGELDDIIERRRAALQIGKR